MKKIIKTTLATLFGLAIMTASASAQTGQINNAGPGSNNQITSDNSYSCSSNSSNQVEVVNETDQNASSGSASVSGNTSGGSATSGSASNSSSTATEVTATNSSACVPAATPVTPVTPPAGGGGQTLGVTTTTKSTTAAVGGQGAGMVVASLPATGETSSFEYAAGLTAVMSGLALVGYAVRTIMIKNAVL